MFLLSLSLYDFSPHTLVGHVVVRSSPFPFFTLVTTLLAGFGPPAVRLRA
jgi:hypothetical protein